MSLNVVLYQPEIPQNTGNIARTCVVTGTGLHIIKPMGFSIDEKHIKRAGLDYWKYLDITVYDSIEDLWEAFPNRDFIYFSSKADKFFCDVEYPDGCFLVFGKETAGLPDYIARDKSKTCVRIPMVPERRCLNLSNAVAVGVYEALGQQGFNGFV